MNIPTGFGQVNYFFTGDGVPNGAQVTMGFENEGDWSAAAAAEIARVAWHDNLRGLYGNNLSMTNVLVKLGPNVTGPSAVVASASTGTSANVGDSPNTSLLVHKATALGGRAGRGRMYVPGVPSSNVNANGTITSEAIAAFNPALASYGDDMGAGQMPLVLLHGDGSPITSPTTISSLLCDGRAATQRRRLRK